MSASPSYTPWLKVRDSIKSVARSVMGAVSGSSLAERLSSIFFTVNSSALLRMP